MNEKEKQEYLEGYKKAKEKGIPFFPDVLFKDAVASLIVFLVIIGLAFFVRAPLEERANPADTNYTPRPEWYFLFLFQLFKKFPGQLEVVGVVLIPTLAILLLLLLPFIDRSSKRYFSSRPIVVGITAVMIVGGAFLTIQSYLELPPPVEAASGDQTAALMSTLRRNLPSAARSSSIAPCASCLPIPRRKPKPSSPDPTTSPSSSSTS